MRTNIKTIVQVLTLCILAVSAGCGANSAKDPSLSVWRDRNSGVEDRIAAVSKLIPKGTRIADAEELLGRPSRRERWHGPEGTPSTGHRDQYILLWGYAVDSCDVA
jgi:hypothetical protein